MKPSRILVCGGRNFNDRPYVHHILNQTQPHFADTFCIIQGGAMGADKLAEDWAFDHGIPCVQVRAQWNRYGKRAGSLRNEWMLAFCQPDLVIAFEGGPGTSHMKRIAKMAGVPVYEV